jgi:WD40 repeat protein
MPRIKNVKPLTASWHREIEDHVIDLIWSRDGRSLAAAAVSGPITIFERETGRIVHHFAGHRFGTSSLSWNADGTVLTSAGQDGKVRWWDTLRGEELLACEGGAAWVEHVAWSPAGEVLASAAGKEVRFWDRTGQLLSSFGDHPSTIADIAWHPQDKVLAACAYNGVTLCLPHQPGRAERLEWKGSSLVLAWSPDGRFLATGDQDSTVHFWIIATRQDLQMWGYPTKVRELAWDCSGRYLATGGSPEVIIWDCSGKGPAGTRPISLRGHENFISALAYQHHGAHLASADQDGLVLLWRPEKNQQPIAYARADSGVSLLAWSPDDRLLATGTESGHVEVYVR